MSDADRQTGAASRHRSQAGVALITALLVVAIGTLVAVEMTRNLRLDIRRTQVGNAQIQAQQYVLGLEAWARIILRRNDQEFPAIDSYTQGWTRPVPVLDVPRGRLTGQLSALDGRFNINNLVANGVRQTREVARFRRLLTLLGLSPAIADAAVDFLDADGLQEPDGAEDNYYGRLQPGYRTSNKPFLHLSELKLLVGVNQDVFQRLSPHVAVLPVGKYPSRINVNVASVEVLAALHESIDLRAAQALYNRGRANFSNLSEWMEQPQLATIPPAELRNVVGFESRYFLATGSTEVDSVRSQFFAVIEKGQEGYQSIQRGRGSYL